jgi:DNA-binding NarL/FixJ family response regulator
MSLRIAVIGDDPLARSGIVALTSSVADAIVVAELSMDELASASPLDADVVIWDLGAAADPPRIEAVARAVEVPLVALVNRRADQALAAGARGVLTRDVDGERLESALRAVLAGLLVMDEAFGAELGKRQRAPTAEPEEALTPRELEVLGLVAEGLSNKLIGVRLGISEHTVKFHVNAILEKLEVETRTEAVVRAARLGVLML